MKIIHILLNCNVGGIEALCKDYTLYSKHENIVLLLWGDGEIADEMRNNGVRVINLAESKNNILQTMRKVADLCMSERADVLIAHHAAPIIHLCLLYVKRKVKGIVTIAYAHGNAVDMARIRDKKRLLIRKIILQNSLKRANAVVAISKSVQKSLIEYFKIPEEKIKVIYNGVDLNKFKPKDNEISNKKCQLIYVGRLVREKGVQVTLQGLAKVEEKSRFHMSIIGDSAYRNELVKITKEYRLTANVDFCGRRRDIPKQLSQADIFIHMPVWEEGFGITIIEAMATGLICICGNSGAIPEIIRDGINGFIIEGNTPQELADTLKSVMGMSYEDKKKIRTAAISRAKDFSIEKFVSDLDELISNL